MAVAERSPTSAAAAKNAREARPYPAHPEALMTEISLRFEPPFARVVLNRPERRNAITCAMWRALPAIRAAIEAREDLLVTLVEGEGAHFSAGADIAELGDIYRDPAATRDFGDAMQNGLKTLMDLDRPTIAVIRGVAIGAGLGLALACDLRFCAADAHLAITPAKLGLIYGHAETRRLVELVGPSRAKDLLFTARRIETDEALAIGLIDRRVETALQETALGYARGMAELSQASVRGCKRAVGAIAAGMAHETPAYRALTEAAALGPDFAEGRAAFAEKRRAKFAFPRAAGAHQLRTPPDA
jgi:enoyl-CoA hydratase/carnithine racemase